MEAAMRLKMPTATLLAILLLAPTLGASSTGGDGYGAQVAGQSVGKWERVDVLVDGNGPRNVTLTLTWDAFPAPADFDFTVYREDAFADGVATSDETVGRAWTPGDGGEERVTLTLEGGHRYPMTIEPIHAAGNAWTLTVEGGGLVAYDSLVVGTKLTWP